MSEDPKTGLFLGYPPEDVAGFMELGPCGCICTGCWKVYTDEISAQKKFGQYKKAPTFIASSWQKAEPSSG